MTRRLFVAGAAAPAFAANDRIQVALIGAGGRGQGDVRYSLRIPGVKLTAASDVYDSRLERVRELWGPDVFTTRDYREVLSRRDVDAVIVATPDHWHARICIDALAAGKDVYCQKPMMRRIDEGPRMVEAARRSGRIFQVGSQWASSPMVRKAAELLARGALGELNSIEGVVDRNSAAGAGQFAIPPDASPRTIDWDRFLGDAPKRAFEPTRLFRWRGYPDYSSGLPGDLYVHLITAVHTVTGALGPARVFASGGLSYWRDGREVPDVMAALMDYPGTARHPRFTLALRTNLACGGAGEEFGLRVVGGEGALHVSLGRLALWRGPRQFEADYTIGTFAKATRAATLAAPAPPPSPPYSPESFEPPEGHHPHLEHLRNFYNAVRSRQPFFEDAEFGFRAAAPALLCNIALSEGRACRWDPVKLQAG